MRQMFSSPRLENVEAVAKLFTDAGIEHKVSEGRGYKQVSRREFSYVEKNNNANPPSIWVIKSEDVAAFGGRQRIDKPLTANPAQQLFDVQ